MFGEADQADNMSIGINPVALLQVRPRPYQGPKPQLSQEYSSNPAGPAAGVLWQQRHGASMISPRVAIIDHARKRAL